MASSNPKNMQTSTPTVNPRALSKAMVHNPHQSKRFNAEEWETWMEWDGATDSLSPHSPGNCSNASLIGGGNASQGSTSPSEAESLPMLPLTPVYHIPSFDAGPKAATPAGDQTRRQPTKKRKTSTTADGQETRTRQPKGQKISHNVIEKRYRTNLNDKIARLRDSVPVLKTAFEANQKQTTRGDGESGSEESASDDKASAQGLKFNKATVLTKATEYIEQLEKANARLASENTTLRRRARDDSKDVHAPKPLYFRSDEAHATGSSLSNSKVQIEQPQSPATSISPTDVSGKIPVAAEFQRLRTEAADGPSYAPAAPTPEPLSPSPTAQGSESLPSTPAVPATSELIDFDSVKGSIPVPDYITRNRVPISQQQHYAPPADGRGYLDGANDPYIFDDDEQRAWWPRSRASKILLGSLAGLMIMEGLNANIESPKPMPHNKHPPKRKRMNFLPSDFYTESRGFRAQIRQRIIEFAHTPRGKQVLPILFFAVIVLFVVFLAFIYWTRKNPKARRRANSICSNPERYEVPSRKGSLVSVSSPSTILPVSSSLSRCGTDDTDLPYRTSKRFGYFSEAALRLRVCWHILTSKTTLSDPNTQKPPGLMVPRVVIDDDYK